MYNPKDVFTADGLEEHRVHIFNMKKAVFWLGNNADDLHLFDEEAVLTLYRLGALLSSKLLENGDGETREDD